VEPRVQYKVSAIDDDALWKWIKLRLLFFRPKSSDLSSPPGFNLSAGQVHSEVAKDTDQNQLIIKKSWDVALGPVKGVSLVMLLLDVVLN